jgi:hypothetical protein
MEEFIMAEKILNTRILMKIDTLENWSTSTLKLKEGELAFATVAASAGTGLSEPVVMVKIGTAEEKTFSELPWAFHAKAADVLAACKSEEGLKAFVNGVIADAGIASDDAMQELAGRVTTAEGKITTLEGKMTAVEGKASDNATAIAELQGLVGTDKNVATQISDAIAALNLPTTYAAKAVETTVADHIADTVAHVTTADKTKWNGALQASDIAAGSANGTIAVKGTDIAVTGLGSAAFTESTAYDAAGAAATAESNAKAYAKEYADGLAGNYDASGAAAAAESAAKAYAKEYADGLAGNYDAKGDAAQALVDAKAYVDGFTGGKTVSESINAVIANYSTTEQMNSAIATAKGEAVAHANGLNTTMSARVDALEANDHTHTFVESELNLIKAGDVEKWNAAEQNAKDYADGLDEVMDGRVKALEDKFGDGEGNVEAQISAAVAAEAKLREDADKALSDRLDVVEGDYLKTADKTELQGAIDTLEGLVGTDKSVSEQIAAITDPLDERVQAIEDDYLKAADKKELQDQIDANESAIELLTNGVKADEVDGVNDLIKYVKEHGTEVTGIKADIKANADAIDAIEADYLKAADKTELSGLIGGLDTRMGAAETAIGTKAAQADLEALDDRVEAIESDLNIAETGLKAKMAAAEAAIEALEGKHAEGTVAEQIAAVTDPMDERIVALEAIDHDHANKTVLDGISAEKVSAWDAAVQTVTAGTGLTATKTGTDVAIAFDDSVTFIFDCGNSVV